jgi:hypothetical protein
MSDHSPLSSNFGVVCSGHVRAQSRPRGLGLRSSLKVSVQAQGFAGGLNLGARLTLPCPLVLLSSFSLSGINIFCFQQSACPTDVLDTGLALNRDRSRLSDRTGDQQYLPAIRALSSGTC